MTIRCSDVLLSQEIRTSQELLRSARHLERTRVATRNTGKYMATHPLKLGYKASAEQFGPRQLLDFTREAETYGFDERAGKISLHDGKARPRWPSRNAEEENDMAEPNFHDWNPQIIEEFRANGGKVGGPFEGTTLLLLTTTGAKSGQKRINPLTYLLDGERLFLFAANRGEPSNPDWYHNLVASPQVTVELGTEQFEATAVRLSGEERDQLYAKVTQVHPAAADYEKKTTRKIPVVELVRSKSS